MFEFCDLWYYQCMKELWIQVFGLPCPCMHQSQNYWSCPNLQPTLDGLHSISNKNTKKQLKSEKEELKQLLDECRVIATDVVFPSEKIHIHNKNTK